MWQKLGRGITAVASLGAERRVLAAKVTDWVAVGVLSVCGAIRAAWPVPAAQPRTLPEFLHNAFLDHFVLIVLFLSLLALGAKIGQEVLSPESRRRIKASLDALLEVYFEGVDAGQAFHNRVTLFKANRARTALEPYCRSGTQYQRGIQIFRISDDDEEANEGVGGQAWFTNATVYIELPECPSKCEASDPRCQEYAQKSLLPAEKVVRLHVKSRSLVATPVRDVKGNKWGVLVLDSRKPDGIARARESLVMAFTAALGKML